ncbi:MAG TPA: bifunctional glutamate N-acetyltransferase/amino-acid acetyltransferase ArgJ [Methanomicrobiales archaeon]|nr:bifunctional glutamate N-acetyltransferase/amino-acid acetyltransferase ArgJ [Methanomicrobiales archaeon]
MKSICGVQGVRAAGMKEGRNGLALVAASGAAAGVFTANLVKAAPLVLMKERLAKGRLDGIIVNSGCANAYTGERGLADAARMCETGGEALGTEPSRIGVASTGIIGRYLDLDIIGRQAAAVAPRLRSDPSAEVDAARAIMTTDLAEKHALVRGDGFSVGGICKGSGMIAPNLGTMIALLYTDAEVAPKALRGALRLAARRSFNRVVVDGDMSTNDIAFLTATGEAGRVPPREFQAALEECARSLAIQIALDGEGATKLIEMVVRGARTEEDAEEVARTVVGSPLLKTAVYGEDPNWGRVLAAAGRAGVRFDPDAVSLFIGPAGDRVPLVEDGRIVVDLAKAKRAMAGREVRFELELGRGKAEATAWGCDLTEKYVEINGRYTT